MQHHAYYIEGSLSQFDAYKTALGPFWSSAFERFGIDESRALIALAGLKNFDEAVFLVGAASITSEAQQALLKLFEEPQEGTTFVLLLPYGVLLPTLRSRMLEYPKLQTASSKSQTISKFLKSNQKERSVQIAALLKDEENTKERVRDFINALEAELVQPVRLSLTGTTDPRVRQALEDIAMVRDYVGDRAPSLKMLLEHLALSLPTT